MYHLSLYYRAFSRGRKARDLPVTNRLVTSGAGYFSGSWCWSLAQRFLSTDAGRGLVFPIPSGSGEERSSMCVRALACVLVLAAANVMTSLSSIAQPLPRQERNTLLTCEPEARGKLCRQVIHGITVTH